jgi:hypothetical protein
MMTLDDFDAKRPVPGLTELLAVRWGRFWHVWDNVGKAIIGPPHDTLRDALEYARYRAEGNYN